ncbi:hypothetical protein FQZ97_580350 [compost metagenome]
MPATSDTPTPYWLLSVWRKPEYDSVIGAYLSGTVSPLPLSVSASLLFLKSTPTLKACHQLPVLGTV